MKALFGMATLYGRATKLHHGSYKAILPGAFSKSLTSGRRIDLLLNHFADQCVCSTFTGLELYDHADVGLAFRAPIPNSKFGRMAIEMAEQGFYAASIGFDWHGAKKISRVIDGRMTECVVEATLDEVSFVHSGAMRDAFVAYGELDFSRSLRDDCMSGRIAAEGAALAFNRRLDDLLRVAA
jgi:HK97 family phage prohead protease